MKCRICLTTINLGSRICQNCDTQYYFDLNDSAIKNMWAWQYVVKYNGINYWFWWEEAQNNTRLYTTTNHSIYDNKTICSFPGEFILTPQQLLAKLPTILLLQ